MNRTIINENWLKNKYINEKKSTVEISDELDCHPSTVSRRLKEIGIKRRKKHTEREKKKISKANFASSNGMWKGDNAKYAAIHLWISKYKPKSKTCEICGKDKKLELSFNHSLGKHTRNIEDYEWLCLSCHAKKDNIYKNLPHIL